MRSWTSSQDLSDNFQLVGNGSGVKYIIAKDGNLKVRIKEGGYIPKSGLFLAETIKAKFEVTGRSVLDIGTGETGFLARFAHSRGARQVVGSDIDEAAIRHACRAGEDADQIKWIVSDVYSDILPQKFDLIVSNPPQMPSLDGNSLHDHGGLDGRDVILRILESAADFLTPSGRVFILCFDFLGIDRRTNCDLSIREISSDLGYDLRVLNEKARRVRKGGETEKSMDWIKKIYPRYIFDKDDEGDNIYRLLVVELKRR